MIAITEEEKKEINDFIHKLDDIFEKSKPKVCIGISAISMLLVNYCIRFKIPKPRILNYISQMYELNLKDEEDEDEEDETDFDE